MRWRLFLPLMLLLGVAPAAAAPTCQNRLGDIVRCDSPSAMPLGWTVSPQKFEARALSRAPRPQAGDLAGAALVLACLFAIIALLPRFDGSKGEDWHSQSGED